MGLFLKKNYVVKVTRQIWLPCPYKVTSIKISSLEQIGQISWALQDSQERYVHWTHDQKQLKFSNLCQKGS